MLSETCLTHVTNSFIDPDDLTVVRGLLQHLVNLLLPRVERLQRAPGLRGARRPSVGGRDLTLVAGVVQKRVNEFAVRLGLVSELFLAHGSCLGDLVQRGQRVIVLALAKAVLALVKGVDFGFRWLDVRV